MEALLDLPRVFAGLLMLSLAFWCIAIDPRSPVMRAFSLFMLLRGMLNLLLPMGSEHPGDELDVWTAYTGYYQIAVPFAAGALAVRLLHAAPRPKTMLGLLAGVVVLELAYALDHALFWGRGGGTDGLLRGLISAGTLAYIAIAHALLRRPSSANVLTAVALTLFPVFAAAFDVLDAVLSIVLLATQPATVLANFYYGLRFIALGYAGFVAVRVARLGAWWGVAAMAASFALGLVPRALEGMVSASRFEIGAPINGALTIAMPIAVGWALTRRSLFGRTGFVDLRRVPVAMLFATVWTLFLGALALAIVGVPKGGAVVGVIAVALLLFLLVQSWGAAGEPEPPVAQGAATET